MEGHTAEGHWKLDFGKDPWLSSMASGIFLALHSRLGRGFQFKWEVTAEDISRIRGWNRLVALRLHVGMSIVDLVENNGIVPLGR